MKSSVLPLVVTPAEMREAEELAFRSGVSAEALMDEAAAGLAAEVRAMFPKGAAVIVAGKGNNAGDGFALAGLLVEEGRRVQVRLAYPVAELGPLAVRKWQAVRDRVECVDLDSAALPPGPLLVVDALLGTGAARALEGRVRTASQCINRLRREERALVLAVDLPTGLAGAAGPDPDTVVADVTVTLGFPKDVLLTDEAAGFAGRLVLVPLPEVAAPPGVRDLLVTRSLLSGWLPERARFDRHKGQAGRIGIVAGSRGLTGAARLCAQAAVLSGGGLVTLFCPENVYDVLAASCPPEVMVRPLRSCEEVEAFPLDVVAIGPGLGADGPRGLVRLLCEDTRPVVVDADALNALAALPENLSLTFSGPRLLTPHPGELARLVQRWLPDLAGHSRRAQAAALAERWHCTVAAKSARTLVAAPGAPVLWNSTGHPLMARGGMGDTLTGFCATLIAQGVNPQHAAAMGSWLIGRGAERHFRATGQAETGTATAVMKEAAAAFRELEGRE